MKGNLIILGLVLALATPGCTGVPTTQKESTAGAVPGAAVGKSLTPSTSEADAAPVPLAPGMVAGYMDKQEQALRQTFAGAGTAEVQRQQDVIMLTLDSDALFAQNSAVTSPGAKDELDRAARIVSQYPQTYIRIEGHTDNTGSEASNRALSEKRAKAVAEALISRGISPARIQTTGFGQTRPIAPNDTEMNRRKNRRITIDIIPIQQA